MDISALICDDRDTAKQQTIFDSHHSPCLNTSYSSQESTSFNSFNLANSMSSPHNSTCDTTTRRVVCQLCGKSFSGISSHNRHVSRTHHKARPFECTHCPKSFGQKGSLERHISGVHRKERPFSCAYCAKHFGRSDNLRIHISTVHLKERPHKCSQCAKRFGGKRALKIHMQTVHFKLRPLECSICVRRFGQKSNLNAHLRHVHKLDINSTVNPINKYSRQNLTRYSSSASTTPAELSTSPPLWTNDNSNTNRLSKSAVQTVDNENESALRYITNPEPKISGVQILTSPAIL